jgi:AcrR family transcriptional regulator
MYFYKDDNKRAEMTGLRVKQKKARTERILEEAARLFRTVGYEAARLEDIAEAAELSVGTLYNYFASKGDMLLAMVILEVEEVIVSGERSIRKQYPTAAKAIDALIGSYYENSFVYTTKEMWRIAMAQMILKPDTLFGRRYTELDGHLIEQVGTCFSSLQRQGLVREDKDVDPARLGRLVFNNLNMMFIECVRSDTMTTAEVRAFVADLNEPIIQHASSRRRPMRKLPLLRKGNDN